MKYVRIFCVFIFMILNLFISYLIHAKKPSGLKIIGRCTILNKIKQPRYHFTGSTESTSKTTTWAMLTWTIKSATITDTIITGSEIVNCGEPSGGEYFNFNLPVLMFVIKSLIGLFTAIYSSLTMNTSRQ